MKRICLLKNDENMNKEDILSRSVRYIMNDGDDDAVESEFDDPECLIMINSTNGKYIIYDYHLRNTVLP